jgi:hypothetical protein
MDFFRESLEQFAECCEDICTACQKWCEKCFNAYLKIYSNKEDIISVFSIAVEWEFASGIRKILETNSVDIGEIDEFSHISFFEKVCMSGNEECVNIFLEKGLITLSAISIPLIISKPSISSMIKSFIDAPEIKEPDIE